MINSKKYMLAPTLFMNAQGQMDEYAAEIYLFLGHEIRAAQRIRSMLRDVTRRRALMARYGSTGAALTGSRQASRDKYGWCRSLPRLSRILG